ncbi:MAG TPA: hypothetical protein VJI46_03235 [Candidatus Nanoarchaeia archaeon]|nr:hypothetical protein [Candidatus Nanoarchaeia archaeon]
MLHQLQQAFHSIIKSLEILYVIEGAKPCARILVFEDELKQISDYLNESGLSCVVSDFKAVKQNLQSEFYSDRSMRVPKDSAQKGYFLAYVSKSPDTAEKARIAEEKNSHKELGLLLGYPECCCDFFRKNFSENNTDLTLDALRNSAGHEFPFYSNISARHFDISLLSHFPHSFDCAPSIGIAKNNFETIKKHSKQASELFSSMLRSAVIYTSSEGIFLLKSYRKSDKELIYSDIQATAKSKLYFLLSSDKKLEIIDKNCFIVNGTRISGDDYGVMVFNKGL